VSLSDSFEARFWIETVVADDESIEERTEGFADFYDLILGRNVVYPSAVGIFVGGLDEFNETDVSLAEFLQEIAVGVDRVLIEHVLDAGGRRQLDADLVRFEVLQSNIDHLKREPGPILGISAIFICSLVGKRT
jgi:hypothetical protein